MQSPKIHTESMITFSILAALICNLGANGRPVGITAYNYVDHPIRHVDQYRTHLIVEAIVLSCNNL